MGLGEIFKIVKQTIGLVFEDFKNFKDFVEGEFFKTFKQPFGCLHISKILQTLMIFKMFKISPEPQIPKSIIPESLIPNSQIPKGGLGIRDLGIWGSGKS